MKLLSNRRGDTLVEVIIALVILSTVLITSITLGRLSRAQSTNSGSRIQATDLIQEQYEGLRWFRDNVEKNPGYNYGYFTGHPSECTNGPATFYCGISIGLATANPADPVNTTDISMQCPIDPSTGHATYCFHMERHGGGNWVVCPGAYHPPIDFDTGQFSPPVGAEALDPYVVKYYQAPRWTGCRGDFRTSQTQKDVEVWITVNDPTVVPNPAANCTQDIFRFTINGSWIEAGSSSGAPQTTHISTYLANIYENSLPWGAHDCS